MRSLTLITLLASLFAFTTANENDPNIPRASLDELKIMKGEVASPLLERAPALTKCPKSNGCTCKKGTKQGQVRHSLTQMCLQRTGSDAETPGASIAAGATKSHMSARVVGSRITSTSVILMGDAVIMGRAVVVIRMTSRGGTARVRRVLRKVKGGVEGRSQCLSV